MIKKELFIQFLAVPQNLTPSPKSCNQIGDYVADKYNNSQVPGKMILVIR